MKAAVDAWNKYLNSHELTLAETYHAATIIQLSLADTYEA